jgi:anthranilate synthase/aminodeoxychorismate synthase-like glutamine amidotransferase
VAEAFGGRVVHAPELVHGKASQIHHRAAGLFRDLPMPFRAGRYHSLVVDEASLPDCLSVTARTGNGLVMGIEHCHWPVFGVQFHPESFLTEWGHTLLGNFLALSVAGRRERCAEAVPQEGSVRP